MFSYVYGYAYMEMYIYICIYEYVHGYVYGYVYMGHSMRIAIGFRVENELEQIWQFSAKSVP